MTTAASEASAGTVRGEQQVAGDYTLVTAAGAASAFVSFVSATLTTRVLAPSAYGALSLVFVTSLILQMATSGWTSLAVARFGRETLDRGGSMSAVTRARVRVVAPWFAGAALVVLVLKAAGFLPSQLTWPLVGLAILHGTIAVGYEHCTNLMRSWGRQRLAAAAVLLQQVALVVVIAALLFSGTHASPMLIGLLYAAGSVGLLMIYLPLLWTVGFAHPRRDRELERRMWRFSAPLIAFTFSSYVVGSVDLWVLGAYASPRTVGSYAAAYRAYGVLQTIATAASPVLLTLFVSLRLAGRSSEINRFVTRVVPSLVTLAGVAAAVLVAPAYALAPVVFGHAFRGASLPLSILLISVVAYLECCLLGTVLSSHDRTVDTARSIGAAAVINVGADLIAIGVFGAGSWAPAVATAAAGLLMALGYVIATGKCMGVRVRLAIAAYPAPILAVIALVVAPAPWRVWASLATGAIAGALTLAVTVRIGVTDPALIERLVAFRRRTVAEH